MTFWLVLVVACLAAIAFGVWPLFRVSHRLSPLVAGVIVFMVAFSAGLYNYVGSPSLPSAGADSDALPDMDTAIVSLQERLDKNPDDLNGWKMLARTQMAVQRFDEAVTAYEQVMKLEDGRNAQTLVDLALALLSRDGSGIEGRKAALIESALALDPNNPAALFYSGVAAANRDDTDLAAKRWEVLLGLNPPPEIRGLLEQRVAEWRGEPVAPPQPADDVEGEVEVEGAVVTARVSLSDNAMSALTSDANVFIIARDPAQPSPPIAVDRLRLSELPAVVSLGDAQSMVAGRSLSGFEEFELLARVSLSGGPAAAPGDWFGTLIVRPADDNSVFLAIDQQVP